MKRRTEQGFTLIELMIVVAVIAIIAAIAVPRLLRARMTGNEASAIASLKVTATAQTSYSASCGNGGYAATYVVLGTSPAPGGQPFVSADLGSVVAPQKSGYNYTLGAGAGSGAGPNDCAGTATISNWYATAIPQTFGITGTRSFADNSGSIVWQNFTAAAPTEPFGPPATVIQ